MYIYLYIHIYIYIYMDLPFTHRFYSFIIMELSFGCVVSLFLSLICAAVICIVLNRIVFWSRMAVAVQFRYALGV